MSVTFEEALATLESMFPQWDKETLALMLQQNNNHVENTIDTIFRMEGGGGDDAIASVGSRRYSAGSEDYARPAYSSSTRNHGQLRGSRCMLPADFLQPPQGWKDNSETFGDQQLALLLQNEMFQKEVETNLGADFFRRQNSQQSTTYSGGAGNGRNAADASASNLGIMKGLSNMGGAAKRNLTALAHQFAKNKGGTPKEAERSRLINDEEFTHNPFRHDDRVNDGDKVSFEENPSSHLDLDSPGKSRDRMRVERGVFSTRGASAVSAHDILTHNTHS